MRRFVPLDQMKIFGRFMALILNFEMNRFLVRLFW